MWPLSITIGIQEFSDIEHTWPLTLLTVLGAGLLFYASVLLIIESQIAYWAVNFKINTVLKRVKRYKKPL